MTSTLLPFARTLTLGLLLPATWLAACGAEEPPVTEPAPEPAVALPAEVPARPEIYAQFSLDADLSHLSDRQRQMIAVLIDASKIMDDLFWRQAFRDDWRQWRDSIEGVETRRFADLNYGPWDRLADDRPFMDGFGEKPLGANFYPADMTLEEFEAADLEGKRGQYSLIRRGADGQLEVRPYHVVYTKELGEAAALLRRAADLADDEGFANYLRLRAEALVTDDYRPSDMAWMDVKTNPVELVIGAIETYEDRLFGYRTAYESYVLIKDQEWSERLARFADFLPELQEGLPVPERYKAETPGPFKSEKLTPRIMARVAPTTTNRSIIILLAWRDAGMDEERWARLKACHEVEVRLIQSLLQ